MFVRFLTGRRQGEVAELRFLDAQVLIDDGRAERAYQEPAAKAAAMPQPAAGSERKNAPKKRGKP